ncbi:MAG: globin [Desulforhopalus sp.]|nr:globin [Desulforhopalus sp.]
MEGMAKYGKEAFSMLGGVEGVRALANCFYDIMEELPEARMIRDMHPENLGPTRENLTLFICGWLGGPSLYKEKHGSVNLTDLHALLEINVTERDIWLSCMERALEKQPIENDLKKYLLERFRIPAGKICSFCQQQFQRMPNFGNNVQG